MAQPPQIVAAPINNNIVNVATLRANQHIQNNIRYIGSETLRHNYLTVTNLQRVVDANIYYLNHQNVINTSINFVSTDTFYTGATRVATHFIDRNGENASASFSNLVRNSMQVNRYTAGATEFIQFFEVIIQRFIQQSSQSLYGTNEIDTESYLYCQNLLCRPKNFVNATLRQLFYKFNSGANLRDIRSVGRDENGIESINLRWDGAMKRIINDVIELIKKSFENINGVESNFLSIMPGLADIIQTDSARWTWRLRENNSLLTLLFAIFMIRLPTRNIQQEGSFRAVRKNFYFKYPAGFQLRQIDISILNANLKNIFYFIPEFKRVIGIWPKTISVKYSNDDIARFDFNVNYKMNLIRNMVVKISVPNYVTNAGAKLAFERLFLDANNNIYRDIRRSNPFQLDSPSDRRTRLFVSMTVYVNKDSSVLHIPYILEGPLRSNEAFDISNFLAEYNNLIANRYQDYEQRIDDLTDFYFYFSLILNPTIQRNEPILNEAEAQVVQELDNQPIRRRRVNPPPVANRPQTRSQTRAQNVAVQPQNQLRRSTRNRRPPTNLLVGAPYVGTNREKHFLEASLVNRFTNSAALFKTPETRMNLCLAMSLMRAQLYYYKFEDNKCVDIRVTGTKAANLKCDNMYIECINNYDNMPSRYTFLTRNNGKWFVRLFEPGKLCFDNKFIAGCIDENEEAFWEMAAEEVWFTMQAYFRRDIDYNSLSDFGQAFSDFFNVCIEVYDVEVRSSRIEVITPYNKNPREIVRDSNELLIVRIVYDQGHVHSVSCFTSFAKCQTRKTELRLYNYCPVCEKRQSTDLTKTREDTMNHITKCVEKQDFLIGKNNDLEEKLILNTQRVKKQYRKNYKTKKLEASFNCTQCYQPVQQMDWFDHHCYLQKKKPNCVDESKIYVYDLEASQTIDNLGLFKHECNCLYIRKVYPKENEVDGEYFPTEYEFVMNILENKEKFQGATFIAHNGGAYDAQFLIKILERHEIDHEYVPSPTSKHKFIQVMITYDDLNVRFIDFMRFIPGSLKNIASAFEIPVSKGDFPHKFNNGKHDNYIGRIPPIDSVEDYWSIHSAKNEKDLSSFKKWYNDQCLIYCCCEESSESCCTKQKWSFQSEIKKYCLLDVVVLAEIVKNYRSACMNFDVISEQNVLQWNIPKLDPLQFMTLPQITINTLISGFETLTNSQEFDFKGIFTLSKMQRGGQCKEAVLWLYKISQTTLEPIYYLGNSLKEWFDFDLQMNFDGYCPVTDTVYVFLKCDYWGCEMCMQEHHEFNWIIPSRNKYASDLRVEFEHMMDSLHYNYTRVVYIWEHNFIANTDEYTTECCNLLQPEQCFYGGRCEVFKPFVRATDRPINYLDVTSLYPFVYTQPLPIGIPIHLIGTNIDKNRLHPTASNRYWGFVKCSVIPLKSDMIGLLPKRDPDTGRLFFPVEPMTGCWCTNELYLAMQNGYQVTEVYEIYHWLPRHISDKHLKPYVSYFFKLKQEAEGWKKLGASSEEPSEEEKDEIVERLYIQNGNLGRIDKTKVKKNAVKRALAKLYLNSLWGKFAQKSSKSNHTTIYGSQQLIELISNPYVEFDSCMFREVSPGVYKANYKIKEEFTASVKHGNLFIGAAVTSTARCILHSKMLQVGPENMIYCDTDSIIFLKNLVLGVLTDVGLGKWTDEYPKHFIMQFYGLAPKLYSLMLQEKNSENEPYETFRAKGVQLTLENQKQMVFNNVKPLIENLMTGKNLDQCVEVSNMNIFTNSTNNFLPFGQVYTRYNKKKVRGIITKRFFELMEEVDWDKIDEIQTYPFGYVCENGESKD